MKKQKRVVMRREKPSAAHTLYSKPDGSEKSVSAPLSRLFRAILGGDSSNSLYIFGPVDFCTVVSWVVRGDACMK